MSENVPSVRVYPRFSPTGFLRLSLFRTQSESLINPFFSLNGSVTLSFYDVEPRFERSSGQRELELTPDLLPHNPIELLDLAALLSRRAKRWSKSSHAFGSSPHLVS